MNDVAAKLKPIGLQERAQRLALKEEEHRERGLPFDGELYIWDQRLAMSFYHGSYSPTDYVLLSCQPTHLLQPPPTC